MSDATYFRVCSCGCGQPLLNKKEMPKFDSQRWATPECLKRDQRERLANKRAGAQRPAPRLSVNGVEIAGGNLKELVTALRAQGLAAKIIRTKRTKRIGGGKTCDAAICDVCATNGGKDIDYCPRHKHEAKQGALFA